MAHLPAVVGLGTSNPARRYTQEDIYTLAAKHAPFYRSDAVRRVFMNSDIDFRHLYFDIDTFKGVESIDELHERFRRGAIEVGEEAATRALDAAGLAPGEIDYVVAVSCTGYLCPGISSYLIRDLGMRTNVQRADLLGMGCAGAMPGLQRAYDFVRAYPAKRALLLTVEICSACYYLDETMETVVGNAICADGAAAAVVAMDGRAGSPAIEGFETLLDPSLIHAVGFEQREGRLRIILSKDIRTIAGGLAAQVIDRLLDAHKLSRGDITHWILHSGGRKVIDNLKSTLALTDAQVAQSKFVLREFGNMSSPTVLFVLRETLRNARPKPGDTGVMLAMGPGLAVEAALLRW